jgi:hypothetical protein
LRRKRKDDYNVELWAEAHFDAVLRVGLREGQWPG